MDKKNKKLLILIGVFIWILTSCIVKKQSKSYYNIEEGKQIKDTYYYDLGEDFEAMTLEVDLYLEKGQVEFELIDPNGVKQWTGKVDDRKHFREKKEFEKVAGKWELIFESIDESGQGKLNLEFNSK